MLVPTGHTASLAAALLNYRDADGATPLFVLLRNRPGMVLAKLTLLLATDAVDLSLQLHGETGAQYLMRLHERREGAQLLSERVRAHSSCCPCRWMNDCFTAHARQST